MIRPRHDGWQVIIYTGVGWRHFRAPDGNVYELSSGWLVEGEHVRDKAGDLPILLLICAGVEERRVPVQVAPNSGTHATGPPERREPTAGEPVKEGAERVR